MRNQLVYVFAVQTPELVHDSSFSPRFYWREPGVGDLPAGRTGTRPHVRRMGTMCRTARCYRRHADRGVHARYSIKRGGTGKIGASPNGSRHRLYETKGDYDRAIRDYDRALSLDPKMA